MAPFVPRNEWVELNSAVLALCSFPSAKVSPTPILDRHQRRKEHKAQRQARKKGRKR